MSQLEEKIHELSVLDAESSDYLPAFDEAMKLLYEEEILYVALSKQSLNREEMKSTPVALNKDGYPAFYMFTSYEAAVNWCNYYGFMEEEIPLAGVIRKEDNFSSIFTLGQLCGIMMIMLNEGADYICFGLAEFIQKNAIEMDVSVFLNEDEITEAVNEGHFNLQLPMLEVVKVN